MITPPVPDVPVADIRVGIDHLDLDEFSRCLTVGGNAMLRRVYRPDEITYSADRIARLAARFAAKEATLKVLGTGVRGVPLRDIETVHADDGRPHLLLHDAAQAVADRIGLRHFAISISHTATSAYAAVVGWTPSHPRRKADL